MLQEVYSIAASKSERLQALEDEVERLRGRCSELEGREATRKDEEAAMALKLVQHHQATVTMRKKLEGWCRWLIRSSPRGLLHSTDSFLPGCRAREEGQGAGGGDVGADQR